MINFHALKASGKAFLDVFYPDYCHICQDSLVLNEQHICIACACDLPYIDQDLDAKTALQQVFWGRIEIEDIYSLLNYQKGNTTQILLHQIKYKGKKKLGKYLGTLLAEQMSRDAFDLIVPIPLHPKKQKARGFNQSQLIALGISKKCSLPINDQSLKRRLDSASQTKFSRFDRWDNVQSIFEIDNPNVIKNKRVLLVDDVLTTGATLEAAARELLKIEGVKVSMATIAARL